MRTVAPFVVVSFLCVGAVRAQVPVGPRFQVNTFTTGRQAYPHVAMKADGDFVVVWDHREQYGRTPSDVHARRFMATGAPRGDEFLVNAFTTASQSVVAGGGIALDARGNGVVVWDDFYNGFDVHGRRVSAAGAPLGGDFQVNLTGYQLRGQVAMAPDGRFVVAWEDQLARDVVGRRFDAQGVPLGADFRVNTYTPGVQDRPHVAIDAAGNFTVVWESYNQDAPLSVGVFGQRFDASGARTGGEFQVNTYSDGFQGVPAIATNREGSAVVAWEGEGPGVSGTQVWARRYGPAGTPLGSAFALSAVPVGDAAQTPVITMDEPGNFVVAWNHGIAGPSPLPLIALRRFTSSGTPRGDELQVAAPSAAFVDPKVASDAVGNFVVAWHDLGSDDREVYAQRFGAVYPAGLSLADGGNGVLEVGEPFTLVTSWRNLTGAALALQGRSADAVTPEGLTLALSPATDYGTIASGGVGSCTGVCFTGTLAGTRPVGHVDLSFVETLRPDAQGQAKKWALHVGNSFSDVAAASPFYRFIETLLHAGVTGGCGGNAYCPGAATARDQMAVFVLVAKEGPGYVPPACTTPPVFGDVPAGSPFCRWVEELFRRGVVSGCGGGSYCPNDPVDREEMAVFLLRTLDPAVNPPTCTTPVFGDVPASSAYCRWVEELARRGITAGCGGGNYCPHQPVTREQMAPFLSVTFGLTLYGV